MISAQFNLFPAGGTSGPWWGSCWANMPGDCTPSLYSPGMRPCQILGCTVTCISDRTPLSRLQFSKIFSVHGNSCSFVGITSLPETIHKHLWEQCFFLESVQQMRIPLSLVPLLCVWFITFIMYRILTASLCLAMEKCWSMAHTKSYWPRMAAPTIIWTRHRLPTAKSTEDWSFRCLVLSASDTSPYHDLH